MSNGAFEQLVAVVNEAAQAKQFAGRVGAALVAADFGPLAAEKDVYRPEEIKAIVVRQVPMHLVRRHLRPAVKGRWALVASAHRLVLAGADVSIGPTEQQWVVGGPTQPASRPAWEAGRVTVGDELISPVAGEVSVRQDVIFVGSEPLAAPASAFTVRAATVAVGDVVATAAADAAARLRRSRKTSAGVVLESVKMPAVGLPPKLSSAVADVAASVLGTTSPVPTYLWQPAVYRRTTVGQWLAAGGHLTPAFQASLASLAAFGRAVDLPEELGQALAEAAAKAPAKRWPDLLGGKYAHIAAEVALSSVLREGEETFFPHDWLPAAMRNAAADVRLWFQQWSHGLVDGHYLLPTSRQRQWHNNSAADYDTPSLQAWLLYTRKD